MTKKKLADWWKETHASPDKGGSGDPGADETVEELYERLGKEPAVDVSVNVIRKEMAAVYRDMRCGRIDCTDGTRLAYVLDLLRKSHETSVVRDRLGALEKAIGIQPDKSPDWLGIPFDEGGQS